MKKCILIYDDVAEILAVTRIILEKNNYRVETRMFCDNIIEDISNVKPDIILMDLWIPTIGGESAIALMKSNSTTSHIPIILFSANLETEIIAERTNANGFLKKPFDVGAMLEMVETTIKETRT